MKMNLCNVCQKELSYKDGEVALMMAFVRCHTTNLINVGLCKECYETYMDKPMRMLNEKCMLNIKFGDEDSETESEENDER